jgi:TPR repeat protein
MMVAELDEGDPDDASALEMDQLQHRDPVDARTASDSRSPVQDKADHHSRSRVRGQVVLEENPFGAPRARMHMETMSADGTPLGSVPRELPAQLVRRLRKERRAAGFTDQQAEEFERHRENKVLARRGEQRRNAIQLLQSAVDSGVEEATVALANALIHEDPVAAVEMYEKAAREAHVPSAHFNLGQIYYSGMDVIAQNHKLALKHFSMAAQLGDPNAQFFIGHVYRVGDLGIDADAIASHQYVELAAAQGHPAATYYLALMHRNGDGGLQPSPGSFRLHLNQACELGHGEALACLADMYYKGTDGVSVDLERALQSYERAGAAGETAALCSAAAMHFHGFGTKSDHHKAFLLYQSAAIEGNTIALQNLGSMYYHGQSVPKNVSIAEHFFRMVDEAKRVEFENSQKLAKEGMRIEKAKPRSQPHTQAEADVLRPPEELHVVDRVS